MIVLFEKDEEKHHPQKAIEKNLLNHENQQVAGALVWSSLEEISYLSGTSLGKRSITFLK